MLACYLLNRSGKRRITTQPLVGHNSQGILIAGGAWLTHELLRRHIGNRPGRLSSLLRLLRTRALGNDGNAKFSEQDLIVTSQQHALRLDFAMDEFLRMDILEGIGHLLDVRDDNV